MHDPPGLEVRDDLLDDVANLVDLLIELLLPIQWFAAFRLPEGREHVVADVSFIAEPVARFDREHSGLDSPRQYTSNGLTSNYSKNDYQADI